MDHSDWGNATSGENNATRPYECGSFMSLLESGVYPENYPNFFNSRINSGPSEAGASNVRQDEPSSWQFTNAAQCRTRDESNAGYVNRYGTETNGENQNMELMNNNNADARPSNCAATQENFDSDSSVYSMPADVSSDSEEEETLLGMGTVGYLHAIKNRFRRRKPQPFHTSILRGKMYVNELMNGCEKRFKRELGMPKDTFRKIVMELEEDYGWSCRRVDKDGVSCTESFAMFMHLMRGNSNAKTQEKFQHSGDTVSRHVHKILACMNRGFIVDKIKPTRHQSEAHPYLDIRDFYRPFKGNCIGALDGTHVMVRCRQKEEERKFYGRKGFATQNIMAVCDFDLTFIFASAGWEGTHHDYSIFKRCVFNPDYYFPQPEEGKYYLVDAGYPNRPGFLAPYKGLRYHQADFRRGRRRPNNDREYFNRAHSSLRSCVERTFGVWKGRFGFLANMPWYSISTQVDLVLSSMAIHNFIRRDRVPDEYFFTVRPSVEYAFEDLPDADPEQEDREDIRDDQVDGDNDPNMNDVRNDITRALSRQRARRSWAW